MESFLEIPESIKAYLVADEGLRNVKFVSSSLKEKVPNPIIKTYVTIGINQIEISPGAFSGYMGLNDDAEVYGDLADISVGMKIYCPKTEDGGNCYKVFSKIYSSLLSKDTEYNIQSIECGKVEYNAEIFSFSLECEMKVSLLVGHKEPMQQD